MAKYNINKMIIPLWDAGIQFLQIFLFIFLTLVGLLKPTSNRFCSLVVRVLSSESEGPGFDILM